MKKKKLMVWVDDENGFRVCYKGIFKKVWLELTEEDQQEFDDMWDKMYQRYCQRLRNKPKTHKINKLFLFNILSQFIIFSGFGIFNYSMDNIKGATIMAVLAGVDILILLSMFIYNWIKNRKIKWSGDDKHKL